jgi:hypothetical protein
MRMLLFIIPQFLESRDSDDISVLCTSIAQINNSPSGTPSLWLLFFRGQLPEGSWSGDVITDQYRKYLQHPRLPVGNPTADYTRKDRA